MNSDVLYFVAPRRVEVRTIHLPPLAPNDVLVASLKSAVSAGSELLVFRGDFRSDASEATDSISSNLAYPTPYGYASVGRVVELGKQVDRSWHGRLVFAFQGHRTAFVASPEALLPLPADIMPEDALFFANMETAVNLVQDAAPILGENVLVLGQGIVGLLAAALLRKFPLTMLVTADRLEARRSASRKLGVSAALDSAASGFAEAARRELPSHAPGFDLVLEISGEPSALNVAIPLAAFSGRIVIGSWYGTKAGQIDLGTAFHRSRIRLISSQVSTISPDLSGRWDKDRRFDVVWDWLRQIHPAQWITHRFNLDHASQAYSLLDSEPWNALQVIFDYE